jgi:hypothetical protein
VGLAGAAGVTLLPLSWPQTIAASVFLVLALGGFRRGYRENQAFYRQPVSRVTFFTAVGVAAALFVSICALAAIRA